MNGIPAPQPIPLGDDNQAQSPTNYNAYRPYSEGNVGDNEFKSRPVPLKRGIAIPPLAHLPISKHSISRKDITDRLDTEFKSTLACVLQGPSQCGKSYIALKYAKNAVLRGECVAWIFADSSTTLLDSFRKYVNWAHKNSNEFDGCGIGELVYKMTDEDGKTSVRDATFIVLDNVTNFADVIPLAYAHIEIGVKILVTTQIPVYTAKTDMFDFIPVSFPDEKDCVNYLLSFPSLDRSQYTNAESLQLVRAAGCNPAQIEAAATFLSENPAISVTEYISINMIERDSHLEKRPTANVHHWITKFNMNTSSHALILLISSLDLNMVWLETVYELLQKSPVAFFSKTLVFPLDKMTFTSYVTDLKDMSFIHGGRVATINSNVRRIIGDQLKKENLDDQCEIFATNYTQMLNDKSILLREIEAGNSDTAGAIMTCMTSLELRKLSLGSDRLKVIARGLEENVTLTHLYLAWKSIDDEGVNAICKAMGVNRTIKKFTIGGYEVDDMGAKAIAKLIDSNTIITNLTFASNNKIGNQGAIDIAKALEKNKSLTSFTFSGGNIGDEGAKSIGKAMEQNTTLTTFNFRGFGIKDEGAKSIGKAIEQNTTLTEFAFYGYNVGDVGLQWLSQGLAKNSMLTRVRIFGVLHMSSGAKQQVLNGKRSNLDVAFVTLYSDLGLDVVNDIY